MITDKNYSIVSCSPETLISKKGRNIITKPIAGTLRKNKKTNLSGLLVGSKDGPFNGFLLFINMRNI